MSVMMTFGSGMVLPQYRHTAQRPQAYPFAPRSSRRSHQMAQAIQKRGPCYHAGKAKEDFRLCGTSRSLIKYKHDTDHVIFVQMSDILTFIEAKVMLRRTSGFMLHATH